MTNDKVKEITDRLESGLNDLLNSENYIKYLKTMSKFYNYSFNNTVLIAMQKPDATFVAGFNSWKNNFHRNVKKGEKGIKILAPSPYKVKEELTLYDPDTKKPIVDSKGNEVTEIVEITRPAFKPVTVFDISQTEGEELPSIGSEELTDDVGNFDMLLESISTVSEVPIEFKDIQSGAKGYYSPTENIIAIKSNMSQSQTLKTAIHELTHSILHNPDNEDVDKITRNVKEVQAESVAFTVCEHFNIDTSDYSFGYIASWLPKQDIKALKEVLLVIQNTAVKIINDIESQMKILKKETMKNV